MTNKVTLLNGITGNGESQEFKVIRPDSVGLADTEFSAYLSFYGNKGGGTISLQKKMLNNVEASDFKKLNVESADIAVNFPINADEVYIASFNNKSDSIFKIVLEDSTSPVLFVEGDNIKLI